MRNGLDVTSCGHSPYDRTKLWLDLYRNPRLLLLEKALRLAQRHVRQSDKPHLECFFLGSVLVDSGERSPP